MIQCRLVISNVANAELSVELGGLPQNGEKIEIGEHVFLVRGLHHTPKESFAAKIRVLLTTPTS